MNVFLGVSAARNYPNSHLADTMDHANVTCQPFGWQIILPPAELPAARSTDIAKLNRSGCLTASGRLCTVVFFRGNTVAI